VPRDDGGAANEAEDEQIPGGAAAEAADEQIPGGAEAALEQLAETAPGPGRRAHLS